MRTLVVALVLMLAGCAALAPGADERAKLSEIVAHSVAASRAPGAEQQRALRRAHEAYGRDRSAANRLQLATLLAALPAPLRDDNAAYALLKPLAASQEDSPFKSFAALLAAQVGERLRLARESEQAAREHERSMRAAEEREQTLREQLDALKSIERGIVEREEKLRRNRR